MELVRALIEEKLRHHVDYIFCLDVDSKFHGRWGTESLGGLVAVIHPGQFQAVSVCQYVWMRQDTHLDLEKHDDLSVSGCDPKR